jgi:hypothetical protein
MALQILLREEGQDVGPIDGVLGPRTLIALKSFARIQRTGEKRESATSAKASELALKQQPISGVSFTRGSHSDDVLRLQGTPNEIDSYPALGHEVWHYGSSTVEISTRTGRVMQWDNNGNLRVALDPGQNITETVTFTRGSHSDDVLRLQGTPNEIDSYPALGHEVWHYGSSTVEISTRTGRVMQWDNNGNLRVSLRPSN